MGAATSPRMCTSTVARYGIWTELLLLVGSSRWSTLRLKGSARLPIQERAAGLTSSGRGSANVPRQSHRSGFPDDLWVKDARMEDISGPAVIVSLENSAAPKNQHGKCVLQPRAYVCLLP